MFFNLADMFERIRILLRSKSSDPGKRKFQKVTKICSTSFVIEKTPKKQLRFFSFFFLKSSEFNITFKVTARVPWFHWYLVVFKSPNECLGWKSNGRGSLKYFPKFFVGGPRCCKEFRRDALFLELLLLSTLRKTTCNIENRNDSTIN